MTEPKCQPADTHERHCTATGRCDWREPVWAYVKDGPPVAPRPGPNDHVFLYAPQCVDLRTVPNNWAFKELTIYGVWNDPGKVWSVSGLSVSYPWWRRVWNALLRPYDAWWLWQSRRELRKEEDDE